MTFLQPWAFGFLGLVPVIVLLYLLKVKRRTAAVSTLLFWQRAVRDERRRAFFHRLRQPLSLLLHLLIFTLILLALARPEVARWAQAGASTVLILDARARMQTLEADGTTRFEKARRALGDYVSHASAQNEMALLTIGASPEVAAPFSDDEKPLREALAQVAVTEASGDLETAVRLADQLLAARAGEKQIVVFTDAESKIQNLKSKIDFVSVGQPHDNLAITQFAARPWFNSTQTSEIYLEVRNFSPQPAHVPVDFFYDEKLLDVKQLDLPPQGRRVLVISIVPPANGRGWLRAHLDSTDALALDNDAYAVLPAPAPRRVLLVTRGNWFLEKMLAADDTTKFELLTPDAFRPEMAPNFDVTILDNARPPDFDLASARGNFLFVKQTPFTAKEVIDQPIVSAADARSPLLRLISLQNVTFLRAQKMTVPAAGNWKFDVPLRSWESPLIVAGARPTATGEQRLAAFAFDVGETDLPLRIAFPLLMMNTLQWLSGDKEQAVTSLRTGQTLALARNETVLAEPQALLHDPSIPADSAKISGLWRPLRNGWYLDQRAGSASWIAVNTFSENESNLRLATAAAEPRGPVTVPFSALPHGPLWTELALAAFALFCLEWWLFHRRKTE